MKEIIVYCLNKRIPDWPWYITVQIEKDKTYLFKLILLEQLVQLRSYHKRCCQYGAQSHLPITIQSSSKEIDYCTYTRLFFRLKCTKYYNYSNSYGLTFTCMNHLYLDNKTKSNTIKYSVDKKLLDCQLSMLRKSLMIILQYILVSL